ncbi:hypothetical protein acdb102_18950 [Acidothermaceae bacterium B102]|nr:hypothetical protein acdb102_18950 [Acidothermaceae bacterium B102]
MAPRTAGAAGLLLLTLATGCTRVTSTAAPASTSPTASPPAAAAVCTLTTPGAGSPLTTQADYAAERHQWAVATQLYESSLASATETESAKACAAEGLAFIDATKPSPPTSAADDTATAWDAFYADWLSPAERFGLPCVIVLVLLLSAAQLGSRLVVRPADRGRSSRKKQIGFWYNATYLMSIVALIWASVQLTTSLPLARGTATRNVSWMEPVGLALCGLEALSIGALFAVVGAPKVKKQDKQRFGGWRSLVLVLALLAAGVLFVFTFVDAVVSPGRSAPRTSALASFLALLAVVTFARASGLAMGLRIAGTAKDGSTDKGLADLVRVRLHALGSRAPRGISMTEATDVASLPAAAIGLLPDGPWLKAVNALLGLVTPSSPWLVDVTEQADLSLSVVISRNGSVVDARIIRPDVMELPPPTAAEAASTTPDWRSMALRTGAAAFVLTTLADRYEHLCIGLCGATEWRSLAAQVVATDPALSLDQKTKRGLLANAINWDQDNLAAQGALLFLNDPGLGRDLTSLEHYLTESDAFCDTLAPEGTVFPGREPLYLRTLFNIVIGRLNCLALTADSEQVLAGTLPLSAAPALQAAVERAEAANTALADGLDAHGTNAGKQLTDVMSDSLDAFKAMVRRFREPHAQPEALKPGGSLQVQYGRACYYAIVGSWAKAIDDLVLAACLPHTRTAAQHDTSFDALHDVERSLEHAHDFKALVGDPIPLSFLDLPPFAASKGALNDMGIHTADQLRLASTPRLAYQLHLNPATMSRWAAISALHLALVDHELPEPAATAILFLLLQLDVDSPSALAAWRSTTGNDQRKALIDAARPYAFVVPTGAVLTNALNRVPNA